MVTVRLRYTGCVFLTLCLWCSGIRKNHCRAQWNLGRETAKDRGNPNGEVSIGFPTSTFQGVDVCHTCASTPPLIRLCPVSVREPPITLSLSFHPSVLSVSLSSPICLISSALICPFSCRHTPLHKHPSHTLFSPFIHSSVAADINHVSVCPLSLTSAVLCLLSFPKSLTFHIITSHPLSLINTKALCWKM